MTREGFYLTEAAWNKMVSDHRRLASQYQNLANRIVGLRHGAGGATRMIKFSLDEELRTGQTKEATHLPWKPGQTPIEDLEVIDDPDAPVCPAEKRAPAGSTGFAIKTPSGWVIIHLVCGQLISIDGEIQ